MIPAFWKLVHAQMEAQDFDAVMPPFIHLIKKHDLDEEQQLWLCILYMTFYNEASAWAAFKETPIWCIPEKDYPIELNRRNFYGGRWRRHLEDLICHASPYGSLRGWLSQRFRAARSRNWDHAMDTYRQVYGNGRWATYTAIDLFHKVANLDVYPIHIDNENSSGPADGLRRLFGQNCDEDEVANDLFAAFARQDLPDLPYYGEEGYFDIAMMESLLCDWSGLERGRYYSGRNIDRMQMRCYRVLDRYPRTDLSELWAARRAVFDERHLGEVQGWEGIDSQRLKHYKLTEEVLCSHEKR